MDRPYLLYATNTRGQTRPVKASAISFGRNLDDDYLEREKKEIHQPSGNGTLAGSATETAQLARRERADLTIPKD